MRRSRAFVLLAATGFVALIAVGCLYRGYLAGVLPSAAAEVGDITPAARVPDRRLRRRTSRTPGRWRSARPASSSWARAREGKVYAVVDRDGDHRADEVHVLARGLEHAERRRVPRRRALRRGGQSRPAFPRRRARPRATARARDGQRALFHPTRITAGSSSPSARTAGSTCRWARRATSACRRARCTRTITRLDLAGGRPEVVARGVRNSVGFDFHPETGELWFTDNGRDWLGDDQPPDELNRLTGRASTSAFPTATATVSATRSTTPGARATSSRRRRGLLGPARGGDRHALLHAAGCSPRRTAAASSSPSTARGTARSPSAIA